MIRHSERETPMNHYERFNRRSDLHSVRQITGGIVLSPVDKSREAMERFQPIAHEAFEHELDGYLIERSHKTSMHPGNLYDEVILKKLSDVRM